MTTLQINIHPDCSSCPAKRLGDQKTSPCAFKCKFRKGVFIKPLVQDSSIPFRPATLQLVFNRVENPQQLPFSVHHAIAIDLNPDCGMSRLAPLRLGRVRAERTHVAVNKLPFHRNLEFVSERLRRRCSSTLYRCSIFPLDLLADVYVARKHPRVKECRRRRSALPAMSRPGTKANLI
jgi:hypothetical protein